uniref:Uncharacterized protein n=1 Tax=virus sp. ctML55 TaxID=2827627 RepID=A0A8S5RIQ8_9VIRU|nr:MAG TPA: hypothetical protein [virus sp. ctML55]
MVGIYIKLFLSKVRKLLILRPKIILKVRLLNILAMLYMIRFTTIYFARYT